MKKVAISGYFDPLISHTIGEKIDNQIKPSDFSYNVDGGRCDDCLTTMA